MLRSQLVVALGPGDLSRSREEGLRKVGKDLGHVDTRKEEVWEALPLWLPECCPWIFTGRHDPSPWADCFFLP